MGKSHRKLKGLQKALHKEFVEDIGGVFYYGSDRAIRRKELRNANKSKSEEVEVEEVVHETPIAPNTRVDSWDILFKLGIIILIYQIINFFILLF